MSSHIGPANQQSTASTVQCSVRNTATRWLTTVNYDLLIFDDKLVVSRGISWRTAPSDLAAGHKAGSLKAADHKRVQHTATVPEDVLLSEDAGNRVVSPEAVRCARLRRRMKLARLEVELKAGDKLKFMWLDLSSRNGDYNEIRQALKRLLGPKLKS